MRVRKDDDDETAAVAHRKTLFQFSPEVNSGNLIQILVLVVGGVMAFTTLQARTDALDRRVTEQEQRNQRALDDLKADLKEIRLSTEKTSENMRTAVVQMQAATAAAAAGKR